MYYTCVYESTQKICQFSYNETNRSRGATILPSETYVIRAKDHDSCIHVAVWDRKQCDNAFLTVGQIFQSGKNFFRGYVSLRFNSNLNSQLLGKESGFLATEISHGLEKYK